MSQLAIIVGVFIILQAITFLIYSVYIITKWETIEAEVLHSSVDSGYEPETSVAEVTYQFKVYGKDYRGVKVSPFNFNSSFEWQHKKIVEAYPKGSKVRIYFKRQNPNKSYLDPSIYRVSYLTASICLGALFIWVGLSTT